MENPVYVHRKVLRASLTGVAAGTLVDVSWTLRSVPPIGLVISFRAGPSRVTRRCAARGSWLTFRRTWPSRSPSGIYLAADGSRWRGAERRTCGLRRMIPWVRPEVFAPSADSNDTQMLVAVAAPGSWSDIGRLVCGPRRMTGCSRTQRCAIRSGGWSQVPRRWTIRSARSIAGLRRMCAMSPSRWGSAGISRASGHRPRDRIRRLQGQGDAVHHGARRYRCRCISGLAAQRVADPDRALPTIGAFDHEIAAIRRSTGYTFVDLTAELARFDALPYPDEGEFAAWRSPRWCARRRSRLLLDPPDATDWRPILTGTLATDGTFNGRVELRGSGLAELGATRDAALPDRFDAACGILGGARSQHLPRCEGG